MIYDVAVVGAGASGMMAGICALRRNRTVVMIDALKVPGKKLKATGNGKCNYTNRNMDPELFHGHDRDFIRSVLGRFGNPECERFFMDLGVLPVEKKGYVYPANGSAQYFTELLFGHFKRGGGVFEPGLTVQDIERMKGRFYLTTSGKPIEAKKVIIACGGKAGKSAVDISGGYKLLFDMGHHIYDPLPSLCAICLRRYGGRPSAELFMLSWAKVRTNGKITVFVDGKEEGSDTGELQLTDYGISGIPAFQLSGICSRALKEGKRVKVFIDFFPQYTEEYLLDYVKHIIEINDFSTYSEVFSGFVHDRLLAGIFNYSGISYNAPVKNKDDMSIPAKLIHSLKSLESNAVDTVVFAHAQVTAGGVDTKEIDPETMESRLCPGIYITGEIMDVDGPCGGYNLQWAWSTGFIAGNAV